MKVIGVLGAAHCGSTVLGLTLGSLPGVAMVGETHLIDDDADCVECGPGCPYFNADFREELQAGPTESWWEQIGKRMGVDTIVSTDKRPVHFDRFGHPDIAVMLYRPQEAWAHNWVHKHHGCDNEKEAARIWRNLYGRVDKWLIRSGVPHVKADWDELRTGQGFEALAYRLGLEWDASALRFGDFDHHHLGGYPKITKGYVDEAYENSTRLYHDCVPWAVLDLERGVKQQ